MFKSHFKFAQITKIIIWSCWIFFITNDVYSQTDAPQFGSNLNILQIQPFESIDTRPKYLHYEISSSGRYIVGRTYELNTDNTPYDSTLYVWAIQESDLQLNYFEPSKIYHFSEPTYAEFAISSDEQFIAVEATNELRVLRLQDLEMVISIPIDFQEGGHSFQWSSENNILAIKEGQDLVVWDIVTSTSFHHTSTDDKLFAGIVVTNLGWVQQYLSFDGFRFCTLYLERCSTYQFSDPNGPITVSNSGHFVVAERGHPAAENGVEIGIWEYQTLANFAFNLINPRTDPPFWRLASFSSTDTYIASTSNLIWNWEEKTVENQLNQLESPLWLPNDIYFVTHNALNAPYISLKLYAFGENNSIDDFTLESVEDIGWLYDIAEQFELYDIGSGAQVSKNGEFILIDLVWVAIVISIQ